MIRHFIDTFGFEDESPPIDTTLQIIKGKCFAELDMCEEI